MQSKTKKGWGSLPSSKLGKLAAGKKRISYKNLDQAIDKLEIQEVDVLPEEWK